MRGPPKWNPQTRFRPVWGEEDSRNDHVDRYMDAYSGVVMYELYSTTTAEVVHASYSQLCNKRDAKINVFWTFFGFATRNSSKINVTLGQNSPTTCKLRKKFFKKHSKFLKISHLG